MRLLAVAYTILAIAAGARATVQLASKADEAPVPYALTALAAIVYLILALSFHHNGRWPRLALTAATAELAGVLAVGTAELLNPNVWPDQTVWSGYGAGYALAPLVLPVIAITILLRANHTPSPSAAAR